jgi:hypothetical protein
VLVFRQTDGVLEVFSINAFGKDFLELCDGVRTLQDIAGQLYMCYGRGKAMDRFLADCREAAANLGQLQLLDRANDPGHL